MGFVERAAEGALALTMDRIRQNRDHGLENPVPAFDPQQAAELVEDQRAGRTDEPYRQCLEHHGFTFYPAHRLPLYRGVVAHQEGEWRNGELKLAFTQTDLPTSFPGGPGDLDLHLRQHRTALRIQRAREGKAQVRKMLARR